MEFEIVKKNLCHSIVWYMYYNLFESFYIVKSNFFFVANTNSYLRGINGGRRELQKNKLGEEEKKNRDESWNFSLQLFAHSHKKEKKMVEKIEIYTFSFLSADAYLAGALQLK